MVVEKEIGDNIKQNLKNLAVDYRNGGINIYDFDKRFNNLWNDLELTDDEDAKGVENE